MSQHYASDLMLGQRFLVFGASGGAGSAVCREIEACSGVVATAGHNVMLGHIPIPDERYDGIFYAAGVEVIAPLLSSMDDQPLRYATMHLEQVMHRAGAFVKPGGSIVVMSSAAAVKGTPGMVLYGAHKAFAEGLVRGAAVELAPKKIRVNAIRAGGFTSPMHQRVTSRMSSESIAAYAAKHPLGFGTCEDIAQAAVFLLSDASKWVTGSIMAVDGGMGAA